ncbi:MAG: alpha/beta fold hydrolase [Polyangiaceae bacterium]
MNFLRILPASTLLPLLLVANACSSATSTSSSDTTDGGTSSGSDGDGGAPEGTLPGPFDEAQAITWGPCATVTDAPATMECAIVRVPLDWNAPTGPQIQVTMARVLSGHAEAGAFWEIPGGPGEATLSASFATEATGLQTPDRPLDYYGYDHRGLGASTPLGCPKFSAQSGKSVKAMSVAETKSCAEEISAHWGKGLRGFSATNAAKDIDYLTKRVRRPGQRLFVRGISYGTHLAIRYIAANPNDATGVILDSISPPGSYYSRYDEGHAEAGRNLAEYCKKDTFCAGKMGADPWATITSIVASLRADGCAALFAGQPEMTADGERTREQFVQTVSGILGQGNSRSPQVLVDYLAVLYRAKRCSAADVAAITKRMTGAEDPAVVSPEEPGGSSPDDATPKGVGRGSVDGTALYYNVIFNDIWEDPAPTKDRLSTACFSAPVCIGGNLRNEDMREVWPLFPPREDKFYDFWPSPTFPVLSMNGDLDAQTSLSDATPVKDKFTGANQTFHTIAYGTHALTAGQGSSAVKTAGKPDCGVDLMNQFLTDPTKTLDTSCVGDAKPVDFHGSTEQAQRFGTADLWEN